MIYTFISLHFLKPHLNRYPAFQVTLLVSLFGTIDTKSQVKSLGVNNHDIIKEKWHV